jgi:hypothetical protein
MQAHYPWCKDYRPDAWNFNGPETKRVSASVFVCYRVCEECGGTEDNLKLQDNRWNWPNFWINRCWSHQLEGTDVCRTEMSSIKWLNNCLKLCRVFVSKPLTIRSLLITYYTNFSSTSHAKQFDFCADDGEHSRGWWHELKGNFEHSALIPCKCVCGRVKREQCTMMSFPAGVQDCVMKFGYILFWIVEILATTWQDCKCIVCVIFAN